MNLYARLAGDISSNKSAITIISDNIAIFSEQVMDVGFVSGPLERSGKTCQSSLSSKNRNACLQWCDDKYDE